MFSASGSPTKPDDKVDGKVQSDNAREEYNKFVKSSREEQKTPQQLLFSKVETKEEKRSSKNTGDLQVEDLSVDES